MILTYLLSDEGVSEAWLMNNWPKSKVAEPSAAPKLKIREEAGC